MRLAVALHLIFLLLISPLFSEQWLKKQDIQDVMDEMFEYHIDHHKMTNELIERSLSVYIDTFDPMKVYFLKQELTVFLELQEDEKKALLSNYHKENYSIYVDLNQKIQEAILRSRNIRKEAAKDLEALLDLELNTEPFEEHALTVDELEERIYLEMAFFFQLQENKIGRKKLLEKSDKAIAFYERYIRGLEKSYLFEDEKGAVLAPEKKRHHLVEHILKSLASSLDAHTAFFNAMEAYDMRVRLEKGFPGIGVVLQEGIEGVSVVRLVEGGPAFKSGELEAGDILVSIDEKSIEGLSFDSVLDLIRGEKGSSVFLGVKRFDDDTELFKEIEIIREHIVVDEKRVDVSYESYADGVIGKITLYSFYEGNGVSSEKDVREALEKLSKEHSLKGIVLDLRENSGGFLMQAVKVAGLFISNGVVVVSKYSTGQERYFRDIDGHTYYNGPLVVLTSKMSASAAEIVAQALQDYGVGVVVGDEHTYGKGSIQHQTVTQSDENSFFKVTVGKYYTVSGRSTQIEGVQADITVPTIYHQEELGEKYLDYPLSRDEIHSSFQDGLKDVDQDVKRWYQRYYIPSLQKPNLSLRLLIPQLRENSQYRILNNENYQKFLDQEDEDQEEKESSFVFYEKDREDFGSNDLQMKEAVNIVKDMIFLMGSSSKQSSKEPLLILSK